VHVLRFLPFISVYGRLQACAFNLGIQWTNQREWKRKDQIRRTKAKKRPTNKGMNSISTRATSQKGGQDWDRPDGSGWRACKWLREREQKCENVHGEKFLEKKVLRGFKLLKAQCQEEEKMPQQTVWETKKKSFDDLPNTKNTVKNDKKMRISLYSHDQQQLLTLCGASQRQFYATHIVALDKAHRELSIDTRTILEKFEEASH